MIFYINNYEVIVGSCLSMSPLRYKIFSWLCPNNKKRFYLGLTLCWLSVTIQKNKK